MSEMAIAQPAVPELLILSYQYYFPQTGAAFALGLLPTCGLDNPAGMCDDRSASSGEDNGQTYPSSNRFQSILNNNPCRQFVSSRTGRPRPNIAEIPSRCMISFAAVTANQSCP